MCKPGYVGSSGAATAAFVAIPVTTWNSAPIAVASCWMDNSGTLYAKDKASVCLLIMPTKAGGLLCKAIN